MKAYKQFITQSPWVYQGFRTPPSTKPAMMKAFLTPFLSMNALIIDLFEFCLLKQSRQGEMPVSNLLRLAKETIDKSSMVDWSLKGEINSFRNLQLRLSVSGKIQLICQRCLLPFAFHIKSDAVFLLAKDEEDANEIEKMLENEDFDVIVGTKTFNIVELIEDEALLALPLSSKHEACFNQIMANKLLDSQKDLPFAMLKSMKR